MILSGFPPLNRRVPFGWIISAPNAGLTMFSQPSTPRMVAKPIRADGFGEKLDAHCDTIYPPGLLTSDRRILSGGAGIGGEKAQTRMRDTHPQTESICPRDAEGSSEWQPGYSPKSAMHRVAKDVSAFRVFRKHKLTSSVMVQRRHHCIPGRSDQVGSSTWESAQGGACAHEARILG